MRDLPHVASRVFGTPLLIDSRKLDAIIPAFLRRLNGDDDEVEGPGQEVGEPSLSGNIMVIPIIGTLVRRKTMMDAWSGLTSYGDIRKAVQCGLDDARVGGILLDIDSYGGEATGCFELCDWLYSVRGKKPIWSVADVDALSAGYAIMAQTDRVLVAPSGSTGSIGAVAVHCERSQMNESVGITYTVFRAGLRKAELNQFEPVTREAAEKVQTSLDRIRSIFINSVARSRRISKAGAANTEGQWYEAEDSLRLKLVDGIATFEDAFAELSQRLTAPAISPPSPAIAPLDEDDGEEQPEEQIDFPQLLPEDEEEEDEEDKLMDPNDNQGASGATGPAATETVVSLDDARKQGREAYAAEVREISEMCMIFGKPALAAGFITEGKSVADVRKTLIDMRAKADESTGETSTHLPGSTGTNALTQDGIMKGWDDAFAKARAAWGPGLPAAYR